jgi:hypothetical protein
MAIGMNFGRNFSSAGNKKVPRPDFKPSRTIRRELYSMPENRYLDRLLGKKNAGRYGRPN